MGPMSGSPGARKLAEESTTTAGGLGDGEWSALVTTHEAMAGNAGPLGSKTRAVGIALEYGSTKPEAREELTALPEAA